MPTPKKKLPTGPIRIEPSVAKRAEVSTLQAADFQSHAEQEDSKAENRKQDSSLVESTKEETSLPESTATQTRKRDSGSQDSLKVEDSKAETRKQDSGNQDSQKLSDTTLNAMKKESTVQKPVITDDSESCAVISPDSVQSGLTETEHKKVAMRLSSEAVDKLQKFRANTGIPYEILVEVMIRNWENLPQRTQSSYLQQAKQLRVNRLMAGQEKTLKTMKAKYLQP